MQPYQREFIEFALSHDVLKFGEFTLKSGRLSPYFFNIGQFHSGEALLKLGQYYAQALNASNIEFDLLFGPAYKGIPLATTTAIAMASEFNRDVSYCFNRKVTKDHGEGGDLVGAPLAGKIIIVDDVITAGTTFRQVAELVAKHNAELVGVLTALDRQERGQRTRTANEELATEFSVQFASIIALEHIIEYLSEQPEMAEQLAQVRNYQAEYGAVAA